MKVQWQVTENEVRKALSKSGFDITWFFEKKRTTYRRRDVRVEIALDEVPDLGHFIEIEGPIDVVHRLEAELKTSLGALTCH